MCRICVLVILWLAAPLAHAADKRTATTAERTACERPIRRELDDIESRLRAGYDAGDGERLKERRRKLLVRRLGCREYPPPH